VLEPDAARDVLAGGNRIWGLTMFRKELLAALAAALPLALAGGGLLMFDGFASAEAAGGETATETQTVIHPRWEQATWPYIPRECLTREDSPAGLR
jgi:hypothetical protein